MTAQHLVPWIRGLVVATLAAGAAPPVFAQAPDDGWGKAIQRLELGERVIFETTGAPRRTGLLQQASPEGLSVMVDGQLVQVRRDDVDRLWKHGDPKWTGFVFGAVAAGALISVAMISWCSEYDSCTAGEVVGAALVYPAIGGLIGLEIDALIVGKTSVYRRPRTVALAPMIGPHRAGVQAHVTW
jgi:hypothetical protein